MSRQSFDAIRQFREFWDHLDEGDVGRTGRFKVRAKIAYHSPKLTDFDESYVTILFNGYDEGQIEIDETLDFDVANYHLSFTPTWQSYIFDTDSDALIVEGSSEKMGGEYQVRILRREKQ